MKYTITTRAHEHTYYEFETATFACGFYWEYASRPERKRTARRLQRIVEAAFSAVVGDDPLRLVKALEPGKDEFPGLDWSPLLATALTEGAFQCALHMLKAGYRHDFYCEHLNLPDGTFLADAPPSIILAFQFHLSPSQVKRDLMVNILIELLQRGVQMDDACFFRVNGVFSQSVPKDLLDEVGVWGVAQADIERRELERVVSIDIQEQRRPLRI